MRSYEVHHDGERAEEPALRRGVPASIVVIAHDQPREVRAEKVRNRGGLIGAIRELREGAQHLLQPLSLVLGVGRVVSTRGSDQNAHELLLVVRHQHLELDPCLFLQKLFASFHRRRGSLGAVVDQVGDGGVAPVVQDPAHCEIGTEPGGVRLERVEVLTLHQPGHRRGQNLQQKVRVRHVEQSLRHRHEHHRVARERDAEVRREQTVAQQKLTRSDTPPRRGGAHQVHRRGANARVLIVEPVQNHDERRSERVLVGQSGCRGGEDLQRGFTHRRVARRRFDGRLETAEQCEALLLYIILQVGRLLRRLRRRGVEEHAARRESRSRVSQSRAHPLRPVQRERRRQRGHLRRPTHGVGAPVLLRVFKHRG